MSFLRFWWSALRESLGVGWIVFGIVSTAMPAAFALLRYWSYAASLPWVKWIVEYQAELQVCFAALAVVAYCVYAPFKLYKKRDVEIASARQENETLKLQAESLTKEKRRLEQDNQLANLLERQIAATQKGSLSNRTNILAAEIWHFIKDYDEKQNQITEEWRMKGFNWSGKGFNRSGTEADEAANFIKMSDKSTALFNEVTHSFMGNFAARIISIAGELRANGLTDPKLDKWTARPTSAGATTTFSRIAIALSELALKMEEKEKAPH